MTENSKKKIAGWITAGAAFVYYWVMALYKLTVTPIWQDEAMEFYCSIPDKGAIRGVTEYTTMYERMAYIQQQPPLYNWLMCLWLQVREDEWWFRFSSVVMGFLAVVGLYLVVKKLCSHFTAVLSVFVFSSIYIVMYYVKEASEYILLIGLLIWTLYLYLHILEKITIKRVVLFTFVCIVDVYTHYSAAFVIVPMALQLLYHYYKMRDKRAGRVALGSYAAAVVAAGLPLIYFFVLPQSTNAVSTLETDKPLDIAGNNIILDFFDSMMWTLRWCMLDYDRDHERLEWAIWIILFGLLILSVICFRCTKRKEVRYLLACNVGIYLIYYVLTTLNIYAYGWFGNRYNLFILPIWFITIFTVLYELVSILRKNQRAAILRLARYAGVLLVMCAALFSCYGVKRINDHWDKMDLRTVVATWYEQDGEEIPTYVNFHQRYPFVYYLTHNDQYTESTWDNLYTSQNLDSLSYNAEEWMDFLENTVYPDGLPERLYVVSGQRDTIVNALETYGYQVEPVIDGTAKLFLLTAPE